MSSPTDYDSDGEAALKKFYETGETFATEHPEKYMELTNEIRLLKTLLGEATIHLATVGDGCSRSPDIDGLETRILKAIRR